MLNFVGGVVNHADNRNGSIRVDPPYPYGHKNWSNSQQLEKAKMERLNCPQY